MWNPKNKTSEKQNRLIDNGNELFDTRVGQGLGADKIISGDKEIQATRYKISKSWGYNVQIGNTVNDCNNFGWGWMVTGLIVGIGCNV